MLALAAALLHVALPVLCLLVAGREAGRRGLLWSAVAGLALYQVLILALGLALGHLDLLAPPVPLAVFGASAAALALAARRGVRPLAGALRPHLAAARDAVTGPGGTLLALAVALATALFVLSAAQDWTVGTTQLDGLDYHVPRALLWSWHGGFAPWPASQWQQVGLPVGGDLALLPGVFLGCGWRGGALSGMWLTCGAAAAVASMARFLGLGRRAAVLASLALLSFPAVGLRLGDIDTDVAAAFPLLAAWVLATGAGSAAEAILVSTVLAGTALACKSNVAPVAVLGGIVLAGHLRARLRLDARRAVASGVLGLVAAALLVLASYQPVLVLFGDLLGGAEGRSVSSLRDGPRAVARATAFYALAWAVEPFAAVPEPPRADLLDRLGLGRAYSALGAEPRGRWYPALDGDTSRTGLLPALAIPWLLGVLPRPQRAVAAVALVLGFLALQSPVGLQPYASRFTVTLLALVAVLWAARAATHPRLVAGLVAASLIATSVTLARAVLPELRNARFDVPGEQRRLIDELAGRPLWVVTGGLSTDAWLAGLDGELRFEYLACPADGDWPRHLREASSRSPRLLLAHESADTIRPGPNYASRLFPVCREMPRAGLADALRSAGWHVEWERPGHQLWSAQAP